MRYLSQIFQPVITIPKNARIKSTEITCLSQKLLMECGLIRPTSTGLFALLPLAQRAIDKLETLVRRSIENAGGQRISLPTLTASRLWEKSGRLQGCQGELLQTTDRHNKKYILSPTHEEAIADLLGDVAPFSYKQLPLLLYQISNKYRDEHRPKHGLLRAREFSMMDAYGLHARDECSRVTYDRVSAAYRQLFDALELNAYSVEAPCGDMGGSMSHEWHVEAEAGEDQLSTCRNCRVAVIKEDGGTCRLCHEPLTDCNSIEVGHTFVLGTRYSDAMNTKYTTSDGKEQSIIMSCFGIGLTRLLAASVETLSSEKAIKWPPAVAPYSVLIIGPKEGSKEWIAGGYERALLLSQQLSKLPHLTDDVLIDDRHGLTIGKRLIQAEKTGYPIVVVCGGSAVATPPRYEVRFGGATGGAGSLSLAELVALVTERPPSVVMQQVN